MALLSCNLSKGNCVTNNRPAARQTDGFKPSLVPTLPRQVSSEKEICLKY